jgi:hypothetical protein
MDDMNLPRGENPAPAHAAPTLADEVACDDQWI